MASPVLHMKMTAYFHVLYMYAQSDHMLLAQITLIIAV